MRLFQAHRGIPHLWNFNRQITLEFMSSQSGTFVICVTRSSACRWAFLIDLYRVCFESTPPIRSVASFLRWSGFFAVEQLCRSVEKKLVLESFEEILYRKLDFRRKKKCKEIQRFTYNKDLLCNHVRLSYIVALLLPLYYHLFTYFTPISNSFNEYPGALFEAPIN